MANEKIQINPEAAVKFFVGLASAGIGFAAVFAEKYAIPKHFPFSVILPLGLVSLVFFGYCLVCAIFFYYGAMDLGPSMSDSDKEYRKKAVVRKAASLCGLFCLLGVLNLGMAAVCLLLGVLNAAVRPGG